MNEQRSFYYSIVAGWLIIALAIIFVAPLIVPYDHRSDYFWYRLIWTEILWLLFWLSLSIYTTQKDSTTRFGGIAPTICLVVSTVTILSFTLMIASSSLPNYDPTGRWHMALQIIFFAVAGLAVVFLSISRAGAAEDLRCPVQETPTPKQLHDLLALQESSLHTSSSTPLRNSIRRLRETLLHSLNESLSLYNHAEYRELSRDVLALRDSLAEITRANEQQFDSANSLTGSVTALTARVQLLATSLVKR